MNKIDQLCERVNEKYHLKPRSVGSVERYTDMSGTAVVLIANNHGGHMELMRGDEKGLTAFLENILNDKTVLYRIY